MALSEAQLRHFWRTKFPWILIIYILLFAVFRLLAARIPTPASLDFLMVAALTSYIFLYVFYLYGVRPAELEHHFKRK